MNGLDYLRTLPAYVINMDRSAHRWQPLEDAMAGRVQSLTRVPGVDGWQVPDDTIRDFAHRANVVSRGAPALKITPRKSLNYWRGSYGCYTSHLNAIRQALADGHERFLILEDDARLREPLARVTAAPPPAMGINVWGGALLGGSYTTHARRAMNEPVRNDWSRIEPLPHKVRNRYQTTAMEMDSWSAMEWLAIIEAHPQAYDSSWWFAMMTVPTYVPQTEVIYQDLEIGSERSAASGAARRRAASRLALEEVL